MYINVSWDKPARANGILTGYVVTYQRTCEFLLRNIAMSMSVCLSVHEHISRTTRPSYELHQIFCAYYLWPWLGHPVGCHLCRMAGKLRDSIRHASSRSGEANCCELLYSVYTYLLTLRLDPRLCNTPFLGFVRSIPPQTESGSSKPLFHIIYIQTLPTDRQTDRTDTELDRY